MVNIRRIERLNDLVREIEGDYPYQPDAEEETVLDAERAICRTAAEISGLTPGRAEFSADCIGGVEYALTSFDEEAEEGLRRFAELAKEE